MKNSMFRWMLVLNVLLVTLLFPAQAATGEVIDSGYCGYDYGENVTWTLYSDGTLVLDGTGRTDYYGGYYFRGDAPWTDHADEIKTIRVEGGITELSAGLFDTCSSATELILGTDTITEIALDVFPNNASLERITTEYEGGTYLAIDGVLYGPDYIPDTWEETFSLLYYPPQKQDEEFSLPFGVEMVSSFGGNNYLEVVHLNENLKYIGYSAFSDCASLTRVDNMQGVTVIEGCAFEGCSSLEDLDLPSSLETLDPSAFWHCDLLEEISVPESVEVFSCEVTNGGFLMPDEMDSKAFYFKGDAPSGFLDNLEYGYSELSFKLDEEAGAPELMYTDIYYPSDATGWAEQIERYEQYIAERDYEPSIRFYPYSLREEIASGYCGGESDGTNLTWTLYEDGELVIAGTGAMADYVGESPWFAERNKIAKVTIGNEVTTVGKSAFSSLPLTEVLIGSGVTSIGENAFASCNFENIFIPASVEVIGGSAFAGCPFLRGITVDAANHNYSSEEGVLFDNGQTVIIRYPAMKPESSYAVPESVSAIGDGAFHDCDMLGAVTLPESVMTIGKSAFAYCDVLTEVNIPANIKTIEFAAFRGCKNITRMDLSDSNMTNIGDSAFEQCVNLAEVILPGSIEFLGSHAFQSCYGLERVTFKGNCPAIGTYNPFNATPETLTIYYHEGTSGWPTTGTWCDRPLVMIPAEMYEITVGTVTNGMVIVDRTTAKAGDTVTVNATPIDGYVLKEILVNGNAITGSTFIVSDDCEVTAIFEEVEPERDITASGYCGGEGDGTNLTWTLYKDGELIISGIGKMVDYANYTKTPWYEKRSSIKTITVEDGVTTIGDNAFHICWSLTQLNIANSVTSIGESAFHNCYSLKSVEIPEGVTTIEEGAFEMCFGLTTVSLPDSLTTIEDIAFMSCDKLESVHIPARVTSIGRAFDGCAGLMEITVDAANTAYSSKDGVLFNKEQTTLVCCPGKKGGHYTIPDGVTTIREHAFSNCTKLTSVTIPNGVATIGDYAFWCVGLNQITIPTSVTTIGFSAFYCSSLTRMEFLGNAPSAVDANAVRCDNLTVYYHEGTTGWTNSEHYDVQAGTWCGRPLMKILASGYCGGEGDGTNLTWTMYEDGELVISGKGTMQDVKLSYGWAPWYDRRLNITSVTIEDGVTSIGDFTLTNCYELTSVAIPDGVTRIGEGAFQNCAKLTAVDIPDSVTDIEEVAFLGCTSLTLVDIPDGVTSIGGRMFFKCENLVSVTIPDSVTTIGDDVFGSCTSLTSLTIPSSVTSIGIRAFSGCTALASVTFMGDAPYFASTFGSDGNTTIYCYTGKNGWTNSWYYDAQAGTWCGYPLVELFTRRGLAVWLSEHVIDPELQIDPSKSHYTDIDVNDKNFREIALCSHLGLLAGDSDGKFRPDDTVNRAQLTTVLGGMTLRGYSSFDMNDYVGQHSFSDVASFEGGWADGYISYVCQLGLMQGYENGTFRPGEVAAKTDIVLSALKPVIMTGFADNGTVSVDKTYGTAGETVTVTAVPNTGYQLRKILVSGKAIDGNTFTITGNHFVTALFGIVASITTDSVDDATQHVPYSAMIQTDHWDDNMSFELASGKLPAGLELKKSGELYGVPSQAGTFTFTVNAVYSDDGTVVDSKAFSLIVLEDIPENIEEVNKGPEGYEVKEHIGTPVTNQQGDTYYEIDVQKAKEEDLVFVSEGEFDEFVDVYLDGRKLVRDEEYTVEEGSTKITIRAQTFKSAGNGQHVIAAEFRAGETLKKTAQSVTVSGVKTASLGGGSVSTVKQYKITVEPNANGTITCTRTTAREKEVVVITVQPAAGYIVKSVSAGSGVNVSTHSGNEYKFTMPASDVTISVVFEAELPFGDIAAEGAFYEAVKFVYENGIMVGTGENTFAPDANLSRAMVVQVLYNYEKQPEVAAGTDFTDVPEDQWYTSAVRWATEKGVVAGYGDGTFGTNDDVTIEQVAVILWNYAGQPMAEGETVPTESSQWAVNALDWCAKQGILEGIDATDTTVAATRAQTAQILMNFLSNNQQ